MSADGFREPATLGELLEENAARFRDRVAVLSGDSDPITHGALADCIRGLRADLRRAGVGRADRVALML
ncbi:MAG: hypothetical protein JNL10_02765, partial [Verrucomicrobiales bacterium]|nr:hypothetical protein [Verrucomicrobiales bacterium]